MNRVQFLVAWALLAAIKIALAASIPLFGDEAFYWWESRHPAWSYSDLPALTAWLIAAGTALLPGEIGVRLPFLLLGLLLPWQVRALAALDGDVARGWRAASLSLLLPLALLLGVLALPDAPLLAASLALAHFLARALRGDGLRDWLAVGAFAAVGLLSHYRFGVLLVAVAVLLLALPEGRRALRGRGPWLAAAVGLLGLLPLLAFNIGHDFAAIRFQLLDRHPWNWQGSGWLQLPEQALVTGPLLFGLLALVVVRWLRRRPLAWPDRVLVPLALLMWGLIFVLGFFADNERFRWHWPLTATVLLLPLLAGALPQLSRRWVVATVFSNAVIAGLALAWLAMTVAPLRGGDWLEGKRYPANFTGWREAAAWMSALPPDDRPLQVVDNFMLGAALDFYRDRDGPVRPIRVLDDPLNRQHGRATQLLVWGLDESVLAQGQRQSGWLLAEETARRFSDRWAWYQGLCARFAGLELDGDLVIDGGRKRFVRWRFEAYDPRGSCTRPASLPPLGWVELPERVRRGEPIAINGWALQPALGIDAVEVVIDLRVVATLQRDIEIDWVERRWGEVGDDAGRRLGFRGEVASDGLAPGRHWLSVRVRRADGRLWTLQGGVLHVD